jgi:hypothetical protein
MYRFLDVDRGWLWFRYPLGVISGEVLMALPKPANRDGKIGASADEPLAGKESRERG